jgi:hypothetical protein
VNLCLPLEIRSDGKFNFDDTASYWLNICLEFKAWELMYKFVDDFAHLRELDYLSNLLGAHVIEVLPSELLLLFNLPENFLWYTMVLP